VSVRGVRLGPIDLLLFGPALAVFVVWTADDGGYDPTRWYPGMIVLLAVLAGVVACAPRFAPRPSRAALAAQALLFAYTVWTFLSIAWAGVRGDAWNGANRTLLYLVVFVVFSSWRWTFLSALCFLGCWAGAVVMVCGAELVRAATAAQPDGFFLYGRLSEPFGYSNATAAALGMTFWPLVACAQVRWLHPLLRGLALALAGSAVDLMLLAHSGGSVLAFPVVLVVYLALARQRVRAAIAVGLALAPALVVGNRLVDVYDAALAGRAGAQVDEAAWALGATAAVLLVAGAGAAILDARVSLARGRYRTLARAAAIAGAAVVAVGALVVVATSAHVPSGGGGNRHDFWRVALSSFRDHPIAGVGVDNFAVDYIRERRSAEQPLYPHSSVLRLFSQTGLVGAGLVFAFLGAALAAAVPALRRSGARSAGAAAGALVAYWLVHGAFDWFWEIPALTAPAFAALGILAALAPRPLPARDVRLVVVPLAALAAVALVPPWLAAREVEGAADVWRSDPAGAYARLDRARRLNALSEQADLMAGAIAARRADWPRMRTSFERALERNDKSWYAWYELGSARSELGDRAGALDAFRRARRLDPLEPELPYSIATLRRDGKVPPQQLDRVFIRPVIAAAGRLS
jgi:tetratricopeptide (TPR) repeat protein